MHSLVPLLFAAAAVCARPNGPLQTPAPQMPQAESQKEDRNVKEDSFKQFFHDNTEETDPPRKPYMERETHSERPFMPTPHYRYWFEKELNKLNEMQQEPDRIAYEREFARAIFTEPNLLKWLDSRLQIEKYDIPDGHLDAPLPPRALVARRMKSKSKLAEEKMEDPDKAIEDQRNDFAYTPLEKSYFDPFSKSANNKPATQGFETVHHEGGDHSSMLIEPPRQIRQNPNLSRTKTLVAENLDKLRAGLTRDDSGTTEKPRSIHLPENANIDPADSIYGMAIVAAVGTAIALTIVGFAFGWYTMTKRAKAAADVDYPAYGVTGPTVDMSGDRKLAHSAQMYHYQHQKQQILAMERNGMEQRNGSVSDPESEEENEEGDYTVYECPGFATTGDMEVKNPLFSEDPTPATPGKCELVKQQPKD